MKFDCKGIVEVIKTCYRDDAKCAIVKDGFIYVSNGFVLYKGQLVDHLKGDHTLEEALETLNNLEGKVLDLATLVAIRSSKKVEFQEDKILVINRKGEINKFSYKSGLPYPMVENFNKLIERSHPIETMEVPVTPKNLMLLLNCFPNLNKEDKALYMSFKQTKKINYTLFEFSHTSSIGIIVNRGA